MKIRNQYYLLRHGKTIYQTKKRRIIYPSPDSPETCLTQKSQREIRKLAKEKIKKLDINLIYSSDFFRTRQTAEIVAKELGKEIIFDKRLRDINLGIYHGRLKKEFYQDFPWDFPLKFIKPPKGENWQDCQKRIFNFFKEIDKKYKGKTILIVSHGDPLWLLEGKVNGKSLEFLIKTSKNNYIQTGELRKL